MVFNGFCVQNSTLFASFEEQQYFLHSSTLSLKMRELQNSDDNGVISHTYPSGKFFPGDNRLAIKFKFLFIVSLFIRNFS